MLVRMQKPYARGRLELTCRAWKEVLLYARAAAGYESEAKHPAIRGSHRTVSADDGSLDIAVRFFRSRFSEMEEGTWRHYPSWQGMPLKGWTQAEAIPLLTCDSDHELCWWDSDRDWSVYLRAQVRKTLRLIQHCQHTPEQLTATLGASYATGWRTRSQKGAKEAGQGSDVKMPRERDVSDSDSPSEDELDAKHGLGVPVARVDAKHDVDTTPSWQDASFTRGGARLRGRSRRRTDGVPTPGRGGTRARGRTPSRVGSRALVATPSSSMYRTPKRTKRVSSKDPASDSDSTDVRHVSGVAWHTWWTDTPSGGSNSD